MKIKNILMALCVATVFNVSAAEIENKMGESISDKTLQEFIQEVNECEQVMRDSVTAREKFLIRQTTQEAADVRDSALSGRDQMEDSFDSLRITAESAVKSAIALEDALRERRRASESPCTRDMRRVKDIVSAYVWYFLGYR